MKDTSWSSYNPETTLFDGLYFRVNWSGKVDSVEVNSGLETSKVRLMYRVQGSPIQIKIQPFRKPVKKFNSTDHMPKRTQIFRWSLDHLPHSNRHALSIKSSSHEMPRYLALLGVPLGTKLKRIEFLTMYEMNLILWSLMP